MACSFPNSGSAISTNCYSNLNQFGVQRANVPWSFNHPIFSPSKQTSREQASTKPDLDFKLLEKDIVKNVLSDDLEEVEKFQGLNNFPSFNYAPTTLPAFIRSNGRFDEQIENGYLFNDLIPEALGLPTIPQTIRSFENNNNTEQPGFANISTQHQDNAFLNSILCQKQYETPKPPSPPTFVPILRKTPKLVIKKSSPNSSVCESMNLSLPSTPGRHTPNSQAVISESAMRSEDSGSDNSELNFSCSTPPHEVQLVIMSQSLGVDQKMISEGEQQEIASQATTSQELVTPKLDKPEKNNQEADFPPGFGLGFECVPTPVVPQKNPWAANRMTFAQIVSKKNEKKAAKKKVAKR